MAGSPRPEPQGPAPAQGGPPEHQATAAPRRERHRSAAGRRRRSRRAPRLVGPLVLLLVLLPAVLLALRAARGDLGTDPVETLEQQTGIWALRFLLLALSVAPLRALTNWGWLVKQRRTLGLAAFGYATAHLLVYFVIDQGLALGFILEDIAEHPWVTLGMATWLMLLPLAITSTAGWVRRLGARRWMRLHQLTYLCAITGALHFTLSVKRDVTLPILYVAIVALLLGYRLAIRLKRRRRPAVADAA